MGIQRHSLRLLVVAIILPALCHTANAAAVDPAVLVTDLGAQVRQVLGNNSLTPFDREQRLRGLLDGSFDFPTISRFVLGRYWQGSSDSFRQEFSDVFENYV